MRDFKGMKRQRGRNRGGGGNKPGGGGGQNANRAFDSNGPDGVKIRGHAQHVYEKYQQLSRDAASAGDRVLVENYLQHAEHYYRLIRTLQPQRTPAEIMGRDNYTNGYDIDFEDESGEPLTAAAAPEGDGPPVEAEGDGGDQQRGEGRDREFRRDREGGRDFNRGEGQPREFRDRDRGDGQREFRGDRPDREPRGDRPERSDRPENRGDRPEPRGDRPEARGDRPDRGEGRRRDREFNRDDRRPDRENRGEGRVEPRGNYGDQRRDDRRDESRDEPAVSEAEAPLAAVGGDDDGQVLRDRDGGVSAAPAFLQAAVPSDEGERRPRRRRARDVEPEDDAGEDSAPAAETEEV